MNFCFVAETEEIFCNFEEHCAFEIDWTATERWTYAVQRRTKWENTLNIGLLSNTPVLVLCTKVTYLHVCVCMCVAVLECLLLSAGDVIVQCYRLLIYESVKRIQTQYNCSEEVVV